MAKRKSQSENEHSDRGTENSFRPDVIVEMLFDQGLLFISVNNIGNRPALGVAVKFSRKIVGLDGRKDISALALFRNIEFLGPGREIVTFLDACSSYFARKQPTKISVRVSYTDPEKRKYEVTINHDLAIYRELAYLDDVRPPTRTSDHLD